MKPVLTPANVAAIEQAWAESHTQTDTQSTWPLMLAAGKAVAESVLAQSPSGSVWVLAGKGNNGGDGYVAAWQLQQAGLKVELIAPLGQSRSGSDADRAQQQWLSANSEQGHLPQGEPAVIVDALLGTGQTRGLAEPLAHLLTRLNRLPAFKLAVDVPTGLNAATGVADSAVFKADQTLSFIAYKPGLLTGDGPACVGHLALETLAVDAAYWAGQLQQPVHWRLDAAPAWPERAANGHKGRFGQVSVLAGSPGMGGAGLLAARAALAAGAGKVVWHTGPENARMAMTVQPELMSAAMKLSQLPDSAVVVLGPGLGTGQVASQLCKGLTSQERPGVLDADGLTWLAANARPVPGWVLTPHPGEAAALLGIASTEVQSDRCSAALELSRRFQTVVVLKGAGSLIAHHGQLRFSHPGTVAMATPGMGDTLAGWIGGLMAQGYSPQDAAVSATWWHAASAAALAGRQRIVLATDLLPLIQAAGMTRPDPGPLRIER